jgi:hypothetical protein
METPFPIHLNTAKSLELYNMPLSLIQTSPTSSTNCISICTAPHPLTGPQLKRVLRYLKGTIDFGLRYTPGSLQLTGFCDSDWAGNPDDRRSTTGFGFFLGSNLVSGSAKKHHVVSRSSTEAEYRAMALATSDLCWFRMLFQELQISLPSPPTIWCANSSALSLASNPVSHARTKHIEVDIHFIREKVTNRNIQLRYISTLDQVADIFTKGLTADWFCFLRDKLPVAPPISLRGGVKDTSLPEPSTEPLAATTTPKPSIETLAATTAHKQTLEPSALI